MDTRSRWVLTLFSFIPYVAAAWAYTEWAHGDNRELWRAFFVLLAARLFFSVVETMGSVLYWHAYGKRITVQRNLQMLRQSNFPKREYAHDDFLAYLSRIESESRYDANLRTAAKQWYFMLATWEQMGILLGMRMHAATDAALDIYSPKSEAPVFSQATA